MTLETSTGGGGRRGGGGDAAAVAACLKVMFSERLSKVYGILEDERTASVQFREEKKESDEPVDVVDADEEEEEEERAEDEDMVKQFDKLHSILVVVGGGD